MVTWFKDSTVISSGRHVTFEAFDDTVNGRLLVFNVMQADGGNYTCEASSWDFPDDVVSVDIIVWIKGK